MLWVKLLMMISLVSSLRSPFRKIVHHSCRTFGKSIQCSSGLLNEVNSDCWSITCETPEDVEMFGSRVAGVVGNSDIILLRGDLGAGKTTFTRGLIREKFEDEEMRVTSPSYLLDNAYEYAEGQFIHHMDLYRLPTGCDLSILGIPAIYSTSLCIIEWPQRMGENLPVQYLDIDIAIHKDETRTIKLLAVGEYWIEKMKLLAS
jgi:tRNA threonylcarbamoyladenosine biosynthesis protein TsaE